VADPLFGPPAESGDCQFERRTGFASEADLIAEHFSVPLRLYGRDASKAALKGLSGPGLLHIATHSFFDTTGKCVEADAPPALRSGLALAGANDHGKESGIVTAMEIAALDLHGTQLVVLSSCEAGVGEASDGEGVYGMRRALVVAGAASQLLSLWPVEDIGTRDLMASFYDYLTTGLSRSAALHEAQLGMLREGRDPSIWGAFVLSGDWKPLQQ